MKGTLLVKNVKHLVTCDGDDRLLDGVEVFIRVLSIHTIIYIRPSAAIYRRYRTWNYFHG